MKRTVPLHEFMPYGAPDLLAVARPQMGRALALSATLAVGLWLALAALVPHLAPPTIPIPRIAEIPRFVERYDLLPERVETAGRQVRPTPPREGRYEPAREAPPLAPEAPLDYDRLADQLQPGAAIPPGTDRIVVGVLPVDPDAPVDYVEEYPVAAVKVLPEYPEIARQAMVEGELLVLVLVGRDGRVREAKMDARRNAPLLDEAALAAARQWVFSPALVNGHPVAVWTAIPFRFVLNH